MSRCLTVDYEIKQDDLQILVYTDVNSQRENTYFAYRDLMKGKIEI